MLFKTFLVLGNVTVGLRDSLLELADFFLFLLDSSLTLLLQLFHSVAVLEFDPVELVLVALSQLVKFRFKFLLQV